MATEVIFDPVALAALLRGPDGPVYRDMLRRANLVKREAQRLAPVGTVQPGSRSQRRPGTLRDSIVVRVRDDGGQPVAQVGTEDPVGFYQHEGTTPHVITGNPRLVFYWPKVGRVVAFPRVNHPGNRPNRFLLDALDILRGQ